MTLEISSIEAARPWSAVASRIRVRIETDRGVRVGEIVVQGQECALQVANGYYNLTLPKRITAVVVKMDDHWHLIEGEVLASLMYLFQEAKSFDRRATWVVSTFGTVVEVRVVWEGRNDTIAQVVLDLKFEPLIPRLHAALLALLDTLPGPIR